MSPVPSAQVDPHSGGPVRLGQRAPLQATEEGQRRPACPLRALAAARVPGEQHWGEMKVEPVGPEGLLMGRSMKELALEPEREVEPLEL